MKVTFSKEQLKDKSLDFILDQAISQKTKTYKVSKDAQYSPLGSKIFGFPWVEELTLEPQKITITRADWVDWDMLAQPLVDMIEHHFSIYDEDVTPEENQEPIVREVEDESMELTAETKPIYEFLEENINPQLASHGGEVKFLDYQDGVVYLQMLGGCQGCGLAAQTMRDGIEVALKNEFSYVVAVKDVTDHSEGSNPYYR
ncbi:MAG: NifU family protein [Bdellovibrionaceae bacterium]|nr:NifU family protein [Pseudobdellovibrionaceae bacterium]